MGSLGADIEEEESVDAETLRVDSETQKSFSKKLFEFWELLIDEWALFSSVTMDILS